MGAYDMENEWAKRLGENWFFQGRSIDGHLVFAHRYEYQWWVVNPRTGSKRFCNKEEQI